MRGVIFDLDGTVADTLETIAAALNDALRSLGLPEHGESAVAMMVGEGVRVLCEKALAPEHAHRIEEVIPATIAAYDREPMRHCRLFPGMLELLDRLVDQGATLAILSNKPHDLTVQTVEGLGVGDRFRQVVGYREPIPHKPDPTSARKLLDELGLDATEVLYVGDTKIDMDTAVAVGMRSVAVSWGFRSREDLLRCEPAHMVDHPTEIGALYERFSKSGV